MNGVWAYIQTLKSDVNYFKLLFYSFSVVLLVGNTVDSGETETGMS